MFEVLATTTMEITVSLNSTTCPMADIFNVYGSVHRKYIPLYIQQDATLHGLFISGNCCTCFGWYLHPFSEAHTTVSTASGICQVIQQDATLHSLFISGKCSTCFGWYLHPSSGAHTTVSTESGICQVIQQDATLHSLFISGNCFICFGWYLHPKHVEQFPDKINCVTLHLVGYIVEYSYDARTHER